MHKFKASFSTNRLGDHIEGRFLILAPLGRLHHGDLLQEQAAKARFVRITLHGTFAKDSVVWTLKSSGNDRGCF